MNQRDLFDDEPPEKRSLVEAFWEFHRDNPGVYALFDKFAREAAAKERKAFGSKMIFERMRWYTLIESQGDAFKLNNNYTAYYARLWMHRNPQHAGFFRTRSCQGSVA